MRVLKFGLVGLSGVFVNLSALYIFKNYIFNKININYYSIDVGLNLSILSAIFISILSNFVLNKKWTWKDRRPPSLFEIDLIWRYFLKYLLASSLSLFIQIIFSNVYVNIGINYLISSFMAIAMGAAINFFFNNKYTFKE